ncbi:MAG: hypothetical protein IT567_07115 [Alphaproteobacteria bacterium]|nr:hypothetical protein [Alphaproteobacteria bacterium]
MAITEAELTQLAADYPAVAAYVATLGSTAGFSMEPDAFLTAVGGTVGQTYAMEGVFGQKVQGLSDNQVGTAQGNNVEAQVLDENGTGVISGVAAVHALIDNKDDQVDVRQDGSMFVSGADGSGVWINQKDLAAIAMADFNQDTKLYNLESITDPNLLRLATAINALPDPEARANIDRFAAGAAEFGRVLAGNGNAVDVPYGYGVTAAVTAIMEKESGIGRE